MGGRGRWIFEFEASLVYRVSSRTARATQRNPVLKNQKKPRYGGERLESSHLQKVGAGDQKPKAILVHSVHKSSLGYTKPVSAKQPLTPVGKTS